MTDKARQLMWVALLVGSALLQGCSDNAAGPAASKLRIYAADTTGGARVCIYPPVSPTPGRTSDLLMKVGNTGGWCGLPVHQAGPKPYDAGLLTGRPAHGSVTIHEVGDNTRIDYVPDRGYAGTGQLQGEAASGGCRLADRGGRCRCFLMRCAC